MSQSTSPLVVAEAVAVTVNVLVVFAVTVKILDVAVPEVNRSRTREPTASPWPVIVTVMVVPDWL